MIGGKCSAESTTSLNESGLLRQKLSMAIYIFYVGIVFM